MVAASNTIPGPTSVSGAGAGTHVTAPQPVAPPPDDIKTLRFLQLQLADRVEVAHARSRHLARLSATEAALASDVRLLADTLRVMLALPPPATQHVTQTPHALSVAITADLLASLPPSTAGPTIDRDQIRSLLDSISLDDLTSLIDEQQHHHQQQQQVQVPPNSSNNNNSSSPHPLAT